MFALTKNWARYVRSKEAWSRRSKKEGGGGGCKQQCGRSRTGSK